MAALGDFDPLGSRAPLIVYLDHKSPYAYLAVEPTYALGDELGIEIDWRPLTLDIPSYLGSARLGERGELVESRRSPEQWLAVKYAYRDARRYASLRGRVLRGTTKIWDSSLAGIGMSWAKTQGPEVLRAYNEAVYERFWKRELEIEDVAVIEMLLAEVGARSAGFRAHAEGEGRARHDAEQRAIFDAGIFGVPSYVVGGEVLFGREHLPRVRWRLTGQRGPEPDVAYEGLPPAQRPARAEAARRLELAIDFKSPQSYLALAPTCALADSLGIEIRWQPFVVPARKPDRQPSSDGDRGARHRRFRAEYQARELALCADARGLELRHPHRPTDSALAALGLSWVNLKAPARARAYVEQIFSGHFGASLEIENAKAIARLIDGVGAPANGFETFAERDGPAALAALRADLVEAGVFDVPAYRIGGEVFLGRQHLPLIRGLLGG